MTASSIPPIDDLAPTPVEELLPDVLEEEKEDDEEEGGDGGDGKKTGGGGKKPAIDPREVLLEEENLEEYDSERLIEKLKMLVWAPFSALVPGASSFESENDLKRRLFLGQVGLMTNQIEPHDIADPALIERLEQRNQERQQRYGLNIDAQAAGSAAAIGGAVASLQEVSQAEQKKQDVKLQAQQPKEASLDAEKEFDQGEPGEVKKVQQKIEIKPEAEANSFAVEQDKHEYTTEKPKQEGIGLEVILDILEPKHVETVYDVTPAQPGGLNALGTISESFNILAQKTEYNAPQQRVDLKFSDPAPKMDTSMGGV